MLRTLFALFALLISTTSWSAQESSFSLLDNRFRIDPQVEQVSFVIYRSRPSRSVILVQPDGTKHYAWKHADNVTWYSDADMDIISVEEPMPGPWQAIGKVTPKNNITLLSNIQMHVESFPSRLYMQERLKFTATLTYDGKPLELEAFLDRVTLTVEFTPYAENPSELPKTERPVPVELGSFADDGEGLDEVAGDGVFTVEVPIDVQPGKYRARVTSGNGVFMRAVEDIVLVYPNPVTVSFVQARKEGVEHKMMVSGEPGLIVPGTLAVHIEQSAPGDRKMYTERSVDKDSASMEFALPHDESSGKHAWKGVAYATEGAHQRELVIDIPEVSFSVMEKLDVEKAKQAYLAEQEEKRRQEEIKKIQMDREEARSEGMLYILIGNLVVILLGLIIWFVVSKLRIKRVPAPEMQLDAPPKN